MEEWTKENVEQILDKVENLFTKNIGPYVIKSFEDYKIFMEIFFLKIWYNIYP